MKHIDHSPKLDSGPDESDPDLDVDDEFDEDEDDVDFAIGETVAAGWWYSEGGGPMPPSDVVGVVGSPVIRHPRRDALAIEIPSRVTVLGWSCEGR